MKFKEIIGGTEEEVYKKFPWLKEADFENAVIDMSNNYLIWEDGIWEGGIWEGGFWKDGIWEGGKMWSNLKQKFIEVKNKKGEFIESNGQDN